MIHRGCTGIVEQNIDLFKLFLDISDHGDHRFFICNIQHKMSIIRVLDTAFTSTAAYHSQALLKVILSKVLSYTLSRTGNDHDFIFHALIP